jgi:geranylgeranylglycerol-phosphate geranylgeranyltransferase
MSSLKILSHALAASAAAYTGAVVAGFEIIPAQPALLPVHLAIVSVFLIAAGGMTVNEIMGAQTGSNKGAALAAILIFLGNFISFYFLGMEIFYVTIAATVLLLAHSALLKKIPLAGNTTVAILFSIAALFGAFVRGNYIAAWPLALLAFLSMLAKEIYRMMDYALGEKMQPYPTIATKIGVIKARLLGSTLLVAAIVASFVPFFLNITGTVYLIFAVVADIMLAAAAVSPLRFSSGLIKAAIVLIFLAFLADAFNAVYVVLAAAQ